MTSPCPFSQWGIDIVGPFPVASGRLRIPSRRTQSFSTEQNEPLMRESLDMIMETREVAARRMEREKATMKAKYDKKVRGRRFEVGDMVLRRADALKMRGKLKANWEGPYRITQRLNGDAYWIEDKYGKKLPRPWNVCHLKKFYS
ncbi:hypothetical protein ABFS83_12G177900 [Erythranthe nasuta]